MKIKNIIGLVLVALTTGACSDWFDVLPKTNVKAEELFKDENGFQSALTGCYVRMGNTETYGRNLSYFFLEKLAQRYDDQTPNYAEINMNIYRYTDANYTKNTLAGIWNSMYQTIANVNNLLANLDGVGKEVVTTPGYWELMKGEALGLRAFLHFDLLRMFGPIYKDEPDTKCIPYRTEFLPVEAPYLSADSVCIYLIRDLQEAEGLLENDPLHWGNNAEEPFVAFRGHRMNKYAVKALMARVYLYRGHAEDLTEAARLAKEVIDESGLGLVRDNTQDISLFDETLFGLNVDDMWDRLSLTTYFNMVGSEGQELWLRLENARTLYELSSGVGTNDMRYKSGWGLYFGNQRVMTRKYIEGPSPLYNEKIPLIRLAEMYLIVAEAEGDVTYLNNLRNVRGISRRHDVTTVTVDALESEYSKEFFAEGQLWYFMKRHGLEDFDRCPADLKGNMSATQYVFPLPDDEREYGWIE